MNCKAVSPRPVTPRPYAVPAQLSHRPLRVLEGHRTASSEPAPCRTAAAPSLSPQQRGSSPVPPRGAAPAPSTAGSAPRGPRAHLQLSPPGSLSPSFSPSRLRAAHRPVVPPPSRPTTSLDAPERVAVALRLKNPLPIKPNAPFQSRRARGAPEPSHGRALRWHRARAALRAARAMGSDGSVGCGSASSPSATTCVGSERRSAGAVAPRAAPAAPSPAGTAGAIGNKAALCLRVFTALTLRGQTSKRCVSTVGRRRGEVSADCISYYSVFDFFCFLFTTFSCGLKRYPEGSGGVQSAAAHPPVEPGVVKKEPISIPPVKDGLPAVKAEPSEPHLEGARRDSAAGPAEPTPSRAGAELSRAPIGSAGAEPPAAKPKGYRELRVPSHPARPPGPFPTRGGSSHPPDLCAPAAAAGGCSPFGPAAAAPSPCGR